MASTQQLTPKRTLSRKENVVSASDLMPVSSFLCPITTRIMRDPVITIGDGHSYERAAIQAWFDQGNSTSPVTNKTLPELTLVPNHALRNSVQEYIALQQAAVKREKAANAPGNDHGGGGERLGTVEDGEADDYSVELTRVGKWLHRRARLSRPVSHKYALALAEAGFDQCEFIATGEFSRRKLMSEFGVAQGHAAPILRAIQALPPPAPLEPDDGEVSGSDEEEGRGGSGGRGGGGGGGGDGGEASTA